MSKKREALDALAKTSARAEDLERRMAAGLEDWQDEAAQVAEVMRTAQEALIAYILDPDDEELDAARKRTGFLRRRR